MSMADLGMKLSLPYNFEDDFIDGVLEPCAASTESVYLPMPWPDCTTARPWRGGSSFREYREHVDRLHEAAAAHGIHLIFAANQTVTAREARAVTDRAEYFSVRYPGCTFVVAALPLAQRLKRALPDAEVSPSTVAMIRTVISAMYWQEAVGSKVMVLAREVNRQPALLREFKRMGFRLTMIPADGCVADCACISDHQHANLVAELITEVGFDSGGVPDCQPFSRRCRTNPAWNSALAVMTVMPGNLRHLAGVVDTIKLAGRNFPTRKIRALADLYLEARALEMHMADHFYLEEPPEAWERLTTCDRACWRCSWCQDHVVRKTTPSSEPLRRLAETLAPRGSQDPRRSLAAGAQPAPQMPEAAVGSSADEVSGTTANDPDGGATSGQVRALHLRPRDPTLRALHLLPYAADSSYFAHSGRFGLAHDESTLSPGQGEFARALIAFLVKIEAANPEVTLERLAASKLFARACKAYTLETEFASERS